MRDAKIEPGTSFQLTSPSKDDHLWFVLSNCRQNPDHVVLVNVSTLRDWSDRSCVLWSSDHPFILHESCIRYDHSTVTSLDRLELMLESGSIVLRESASPELLFRMLDGAASTKNIPLETREILVRQGLIA